jgi:hypothetical protein
MNVILLEMSIYNANKNLRDAKKYKISLIV